MRAKSVYEKATQDEVYSSHNYLKMKMNLFASRIMIEKGDWTDALSLLWNNLTQFEIGIRILLNFSLEEKSATSTVLMVESHHASRRK